MKKALPLTIFKGQFATSLAPIWAEKVARMTQTRMNLFIDWKLGKSVFLFFYLIYQRNINQGTSFILNFTVYESVFRVFNDRIKFRDEIFFKRDLLSHENLSFL